MSNRTQITVVLEPYDDGALTCDMATAFISGMGVRTFRIPVTEEGDEQKAMREVFELALMSVSGHGKQLPEPKGYALGRREIEDTYDPNFLVYSKAGR